MDGAGDPAGRALGGAGVGKVPGGTTAPRTIHPVTPAESRTCRQTWPSTSRSGPSTSTFAPSASVLSTRPLGPGSDRMLAPWPPVLPTWPRAAPGLATGAVVAGGAAGAPDDGAPADADVAAATWVGGAVPSATRKLDVTQPLSPSGSRTLTQRVPPMSRGSPRTSTSVPSGMILTSSPVWPGSRLRLTPSPWV